MSHQDVIGICLPAFRYLRYSILKLGIIIVIMRHIIAGIPSQPNPNHDNNVRYSCATTSFLLSPNIRYPRSLFGKHAAPAILVSGLHCTCNTPGFVVQTPEPALSYGRPDPGSTRSVWLSAGHQQPASPLRTGVGEPWRA